MKLKRVHDLLSVEVLTYAFPDIELERFGLKLASSKVPQLVVGSFFRINNGYSPGIPERDFSGGESLRLRSLVNTARPDGLDFDQLSGVISISHDRDTPMVILM